LKWHDLTTRPLIGLDIGRRQIKAAQLAGGRLLAWTCLNRTGEPGILNPHDVRRLAEAIRCGPFRGKSVVLAVGPEKLLTGILELPPRSSGAPVDQLAMSELARRHGADVQSMEMSCWDLPSPARAANRTYVMAVACAHADADGLLDLVEQAGLDVQAVETHATAVARACGRLLEDLSGTGAILDIGWASSQLVMTHRGIVVYQRNLAKCGVDSLAKALATHPQVEADRVEGLLSGEGIEAYLAAGSGGLAPTISAYLEAVAAELRIPLSYLANQYPDAAVKRLLLIGGGARIEGFAGFLSRSLALDVRVVKAGDLGRCDAQAEGSGGGPSLAVAIGLAQYSQR
jgi:type IV pilus assembly protein PilM